MMLSTTSSMRRLRATGTFVGFETSLRSFHQFPWTSNIGGHIQRSITRRFAVDVRDSAAAYSEFSTLACYSQPS